MRVGRVEAAGCNIILRLISFPLGSSSGILAFVAAARVSQYPARSEDFRVGHDNAPLSRPLALLPIPFGRNQQKENR